jgi:hypothetical protein
MRNEATVNKGELAQIRDLLKSVVSRLDNLLSDVGCVHANAIDVTTMTDDNMNKYLCPDCGETIEEEIEYEIRT